jgi:hypothetical protein
VPEVTLYDARTGEPVEGEAAVDPEPAVPTEDLSKVSLAVHPGEGRVTAQVVVDPGEQPLVADLLPAPDDTLADLHRAVTRRLEETVFSPTPPADLPPHRRVFHHLGTRTAYVPDPDIGAHLVATAEPLTVAVPDAATAAEVVTFFRGRAPWTVLAVATPDAGVAADVVVTVDPRYDEVTWLGRDESWVDEDAIPDNIDIGDAASGESAEGPGAAAAADEAAVLRLFEGESGEPVRGGPEGGPAAETVAGHYAEGQMLVVAPGAGVVRARLRTTDGSDTGLFAQYEHPGPTGDLLASFAQAVAARTADLGTSVGLDVGGDAVDVDHLVATPSRPDALRDADLRYLSRTDEPLTFAAPDAPSALGLGLYLRSELEGDRSVAVSTGGRTAALAGADVVVAVDPGSDGVEARGETVTRLADGRLREALTEVGGTVRVVADRVAEVTGTAEAHQRVFAAALSGDALASRGLTVAPVDDDPVGRRRRQARYLLLYGLVALGGVAGVVAGRFDPLLALPGATYPVELGAGASAVPGVAVLGACLAALLVGAYWLFGYPRGPGESLAAVATGVRRQVTGGAASGTVPSSIAEAAAPVDAAVDELEAGYERLADVEGSVAGAAEEFWAFLAAQLLTGEDLPAVSVVDSERRRRELLREVAVGAGVGAVAGVAVVAGLWVLAGVAARAPTLVLDTLVAVVALTLLASLAKAALVRLAPDWLPRWLGAG